MTEKDHFCCETFAEHSSRNAWEAGAIRDDVIAADGGASAVTDMKFCPWCGREVRVEQPE